MAMTNTERQQRWWIKHKDKHRKRCRESARRRRADRKLEALATATAPPTSQVAIFTPTAVELVSWIESKLIVPFGPRIGKRFELLDWQKEFLTRTLEPEISESAISISRKCGKTGLVCCLILGGLVGPLNKEELRMIAVSLNGRLVGELLDAVEKTAAKSGVEIYGSLRVLRSPAPGKVHGRRGARLDLMNAETKSSGHSMAADYAIIDEIGLMKEEFRPLVDAVLGATTGRNGKTIYTSIRGTGPLYDEVRERRQLPSVHWMEFAADKNCALDDEAQWHKANPGLGVVKSLESMRAMAARAIASPPSQSGFRQLHLNQPVDASVERLVTLPDYKANLVDVLPPRSGPCFLGVDLGQTASLSALAAFFPETGRLEVWAGCGGIPDLTTRGKDDAAGPLYLLMEQRGELIVYEGKRAVPNEDFIADVFTGRLGSYWPISGLAADRFRRGELEDAVRGLQCQTAIDWRNTGWLSTTEDCRAFEAAILDRKLKIERDNLLLTAALTASSVKRDESGNAKLIKSQRNARIDALAAVLLAVGLAERKKAASGQQLIAHIPFDV